MNNISKISLVLTGLLAGALSVTAADVDLSKLPPASTRTNVTYEADIQPMFQTSCIQCHRGSKPAGGLRLDSLEGVLKGGKDGLIVTAGDSAHSPMVIAISRLDPDTAMPPQKRARMSPPPAAPAPAPGGGAIVPGDAPGGPLPPGGGPGGPRGPRPRPLSATQVGLVRAWIDQGAK
jgi:Planctomycete cytochrome C